MTKHSLVLLLVLLFSPDVSMALTPGYQANFSAGLDYPDAGSNRGDATFFSTQLGSRSRFLRFHGTFTFLYGASYMEGEGAIGFSVYPLSSFVSERAGVHPFLTGQGTVGVARIGKANAMDNGYGYGAGVDWHFWRKSGLTISAQKFATGDPSMRYSIGIFWFRDPE